MKSEESMAETIENNMRKVIIDEKDVNPKYYEKMSELLDALIEERRKQALDYKEYLLRVKELSVQVLNPGGIDPKSYPTSVDTPAKKALYDNFEADPLWVTKVDTAIRTAKKADWIGNPQKERELAGAIYKAIDDDDRIEQIVELAKNQYEYR